MISQQLLENIDGSLAKTRYDFGIHRQILMYCYLFIDSKDLSKINENKK